jgi:RNA-binding motif X-linked protein 2
VLLGIDVFGILTGSISSAPSIDPDDPMRDYILQKRREEKRMEKRSKKRKHPDETPEERRLRKAS